MFRLFAEIVYILTGFQLMLMSVVILSQKNRGRLSHNLLAVFLLSKAFLVARYCVLRFVATSRPEYSYMASISAAPFFLLAPFLYLYIKSICYKDFALERRHWLHGIPFLFFILYAAFRVHVQRSGTGLQLGSLGEVFVLHFGDVFWAMNFLQILLYLVAMFRAVRVYQTRLKNRYSSIERINLGWLSSLLTLIVLHWLFVVTRGTLSIMNVRTGIMTDVLDLFSMSIFLVFVTILVYKGLNQIRIFHGIEEKGKYADSRLTEQDIQQYVPRITECVEKKKVYLTPSLTIDDLSQKLSMPSWQLSQVINRAFDQNFFNFINGYRIEEAKRRLIDPDYSDKTVLEILYDVGFNSKSTFNEAFKRGTGMTPREFRMRRQKQPIRQDRLMRIGS